MIEKIKSKLIRQSDVELVDRVVEEYGDKLKVCTGVISLQTCEWIAVFSAPFENGRTKIVLKVGVHPF